MGTAEGMLTEGRKLLGLGEDPPGSSHNLITVWYGFDGHWCDMSISFMAAHSGNLDAVMGKFASTVAHARAFQRAGRWHYGLGGIRPGDVVFIDWSGTRSIANIDHVGLVEAVHSNGSITTLEGNTSDRFLRRRRTSACVVGYGRPAYEGGAPLGVADGILRVGSRGPAVSNLQRNLNTTMGSGLGVDGEFGPLTKAALESFQRRFGLTVDGEYGPQSAAMMRAALAGRNAPVRPVPRGPGTLAVDGIFGPATCSAMQRALNGHGAALDVDGAFGPRTKRALQSYLRVAADGAIGPITVRALQRHVGAAQDGIWGPDTNRNLQTALNEGRF